jgi:methionyl-tRNA formyltransferase
MPFAAAHVADDPEEFDVLFAASKHSLPRLLRACEADLGLCTGFPWRITAKAIAVPPLGIVNGHPSLLPRYRSAFPIAWAVRNGEPEVGLTYHLIDADFDTGNILAQKPFPLGEDDTEETLYARFPELSAELLRVVSTSLGLPRRCTGSPAPGASCRRSSRGPILDGVRLVRTSLVEADGAERLECADGPLWVVESETVSDTFEGV